MARVLVMDDDDKFRRMVRAMLEDAGHTVGEARNGIEGLAAFREAPAELVIVDIQMPGKEGVETIIDLLKDHPSARIIAMTGGGRSQTFDFLNVAQRFGAVATMQKPFRKVDFIAAVDRALTNEPGT